MNRSNSSRVAVVGAEPQWSSAPDGSRFCAGAPVRANMRFPAPAMRPLPNRSRLPAHTRADLVARGLTIVCWLLARPAGDTFEELIARFKWPPARLLEVLDYLADRGQVARVAQRYVVAPEEGWE